MPAERRFFSSTLIISANLSVSNEPKWINHKKILINQIRF